jgi:TonB family protein
MNLHDAIHPYLAAFTPAAMASVAAGSILLAGSMLLASGMRREAARNRYALLYGTLLFFALPVHALFFGLVAVQDEIRSLFESDAVTATAAAVSVLPADLTAVRRSDVDWECPLVAVIFAGALLLIFREVTRALAARQVLSKATQPADPEVIQAVDELRTSMGLRDPLPVVVVPGVAAPAAVAIRKPALVVPDNMLQRLDAQELRGVLAHEVAHVARRDNLASLFEGVVSALFWFNPLVWMLRPRIALERERACDDAAVGQHSEPETFLRALLTLCRETVHERHAAVSCISHSKISERVDYLMNPHRSSASPRARLAAYSIALLLTLGATSVVALAVDKPLVSMTPSGYSMTVAAQKADDDAVQFDLVVTAPNGEVISRPRVMTKAGQPARMVSGSGERRVDVQIEFDDATRGRARMIITSEGAVEADRSVPFTVVDRGGRLYAGDPIDVRLKDADLNDVLGVLSQLSGRKIVLDARVRGKVSVDFEDTPWDKVLDSIVLSNGLTVRTEGDIIYVEPRPEAQYSGQPIDLKLKDADLRQLMTTFEQLTGLKIVVAPGIEGKVTVDFDDVPWDKALADIVAQQGLAMRVEKGTVHLERTVSSIKMGDGITPPRLISKVDPLYPASAKAQRIAGIVILRTTIDTNGNVVRADVLKGMPEGLSDAAIEAVKQWKFSPALKDGLPVEVEYNLTINFQLDK